MSRNNLFKLLAVVFVIAWSVYESYPPKSIPLPDHFKDRAVLRDEAYTNIVTRLNELMAEHPERAFGNLMEAIGTNDVARYFPFFNVSQELAPTRAVLNRLQREAAGQIKLGLDLQGGTSFLIGMNTNALSENMDKDSALANAVEVLRKRVDKFGVAEPIIQPAGSDRILIQLPGLSEAEMETARRTIKQAAFLELRLVHAQSSELIAQGIIEPGYEILKLERRQPDGTRRIEQYLVKKKAERGLTGKYITRAMVTRHHLTNKPEIQFSLDSEGAQLFYEITRDNVDRLLAIVLDGVLYSAPVINEPIQGGSCVINGDFTLQEAFELANTLENPLEAPVEIIEERTVDPSLGKDSIASGIKASIYGVIAVSAFMLVYYLFAGLVANVALVLNVIILMGVMCAFDATLTLPGIAGIVLTIGMAVDANVLIFERIREESEAGKSMRGALAAGYSKAFTTILDSNLTTLISAVILIFMGTGSVKGFGITLAIGISTSMFTALLVTRLIFDFLLDKGWLKSLPMMHFFGTPKIDFLRWAKPAFAASWLLIVLGMGYGIFGRGHDVMGVDFAGGDALRLGFEKKVDVDQLRGTLGALDAGEPMIQYQKDLSTGKEILSVTTEANSGQKVEQALVQAYPDSGLKRLSLDSVGPTVGAEILRTAFVATLLALFGILVYVAFRYEFSFAVAAVIAIVHDVFMTLGWFFLADKELSAPMVAAILTIIGFSINDTIVIFDRIREDLKLGMRGSFKELINIAINQTLSRTIITSGTVLIATLSLYFFGGGVINDFAFTFLVGILTGTYSTIYIASAIVLWWHKGERPKTSTPQVAIENAATARA